MAGRGLLALTLALLLMASCSARRDPADDPTWALAAVESRPTRDCRIQFEALQSCKHVPQLSESDARSCCASMIVFSETGCLCEDYSAVRDARMSVSAIFRALYLHCHQPSDVDCEDPSIDDLHADDIHADDIYADGLTDDGAARNLLGKAAPSDGAIATFLALDSAAGSAAAVLAATEPEAIKAAPRPTVPQPLTGLRIYASVGGRRFAAERFDEQRAVLAAAAAAAEAAGRAQHQLASAGAASDSADIDSTFAAAALAGGRRAGRGRIEWATPNPSTAGSDGAASSCVSTATARLQGGAAAALQRLRSAGAAFSKWGCSHKSQARALIAVEVAIALLLGLALVLARAPAPRVRPAAADSAHEVVILYQALLEGSTANPAHDPYLMV